MRSVWNGRRLFIVAIAVGTVLRLVQTATSIGTIDALMWFRWVELIERVGILQSYRYSQLMNHPPFALLLARTVNAVGVACGLEFNDSLRIVQAAADVGTALLLVGIARRLGAKNEYFAAAMFFLSPATIFISAFHCNNDPLMTMLLAAAVLMVLDERPLPAGALLALAVSIKIVPLLVGPLLLFAFRGTRARVLFLAAASVTSAILFLPGFVVNGPQFLKQIFGYTGMTTGWGWRLVAVYVAKWTGSHGLSRALTYLGFVMIAALVVLWIAEVRRGEIRERLPRLICISYLLVLFFAPGFGVQYMFWFLPWLAFALPKRAALAMHGLISAFVFTAYTAWSDGWPWWFADGSSTPLATQITAQSGLVAWVAIGAAAFYALWRLRGRISLGATVRAEG
ncbi:MAG TPA: glycosyltransferase 87 family protein [Thermoanaerobaculia bacterium]|nr:glycosyltransferase 87 family protein [Thermoanaerobaculia bacterium]